MFLLGWEFHLANVFLGPEFAGHHPANVFLGPQSAGHHLANVVVGSRLCWTSSGKCVPSLLDIIRRMCSWIHSLLDIIRQMCSLGREFVGHYLPNVSFRLGVSSGKCVLGSRVCWTSSGECVLGSTVCWTSSGECGRWVRTLLDIIRQMCSLD